MPAPAYKHRAPSDAENDDGAEARKTCTRCRSALPLTAFRRDSTKRDGRYPQCRLCFGSVATIFKIIRWHPCDQCGTYFQPRHNKGDYVRHCSRRCAAQSVTGVRNHAWKSHNIGYGTAHDRTREARGQPTTCERCGATDRRMHWALDHGACGSPLQSDNGPYSPNPAHYIALCVPCHKAMDLRRTHGRITRTNQGLN